MIYSLPNIKAAAEQVWLAGRTHRVWAFHAQMGAGKTTFIHALCEVLDVHSTIGSPTYSIINEYKSDKEGIIYHMDWYRMKDEDEAMAAGVEDCLYSGNLCLVEWPERAERLLPENTFHIRITQVNEDERELSFATD